MICYQIPETQSGKCFRIVRIIASQLENNVDRSLKKTMVFHGVTSFLNESPSHIVANLHNLIMKVRGGPTDFHEYQGISLENRGIFLEVLLYLKDALEQDVGSAFIQDILNRSNANLSLHRRVLDRGVALPLPQLLVTSDEAMPAQPPSLRRTITNDFATGVPALWRACTAASRAASRTSSARCGSATAATARRRCGSLCGRRWTARRLTRL